MINPIFFKIYCTFECTADLVRGAFFLPNFSKNLAKKFHFIVFSGAFYLSHLMHSVGAIFIMSDSEYTPDLLSA